MYTDRKYLIFPTSQLDKVDFTQVNETSTETVRKSIDGLKTFVKWDNEQPSFVSQLTNAEGPYSYDEILAILSTEEWTEIDQEV